MVKTTEQPTEEVAAVDFDAQIAALNLQIAESLSNEKLEQESNHKAYLDAKQKTRRRFTSLRYELSDAVVALDKEKREAAKAK